jgi:hypothetical protein
MLVLLMKGIYEVRHRNGLRCLDIGTNFHDDQFRRLSNITVTTATNFMGCNIGVTDRRVYGICR